MWHSFPNKTYFELLAEYKDKIILEVGGHDHFASIRYHTGRDVLDQSDTKEVEDQLLHNILINPSVTPWYYNNPGISSLIIDDKTLVPHNLTASYLNLAPTMGVNATVTTYHELEWRDLDYKREFGLQDLTPIGIHRFRLKLQQDPHL